MGHHPWAALVAGRAPGMIRCWCVPALECAWRWLAAAVPPRPWWGR